MTKINVVLMWGGTGAEHDISKISAGFIEKTLLSLPDMAVLSLELVETGLYQDTSSVSCQIIRNLDDLTSEVVFSMPTKTPWLIDFVIPCFHGFPGESGEIQSMLELMQIPYLGCRAEASMVCFNKASTKLWMSALGIPNTPYVTISSTDSDQLALACKMLQDSGSVFVKASSQGSSVGCYFVKDEQTLMQRLLDAFKFSEYVLIEKNISGRELEVAVYEIDGNVVATLPGEIHCDEGSYYSYEEKYSASSTATTDIVASHISKENLEKIQQYAQQAFVGLKLRHLSRIDFFLADTGEIYVNEINTFPGMTQISMFPKMMEHHGHQFREFIAAIIRKPIV